MSAYSHKQTLETSLTRYQVVPNNPINLSSPTMLIQSEKPLVRTLGDRLGGLHILGASFVNFQQSVGVKADIPPPMPGFGAEVRGFWVLGLKL